MSRKPGKAAARKPAPRRKPAAPRTRTLKVDALARVEGEGALHVVVKNGAVQDLRFRIFEPPRFFEAFLRGRDHAEVPDLTARICGICPMAYIQGAILAMEDVFGVVVDGPLADLRRLAYCGEWIESHVLHAAMLHAPDFLGLDDVLQIAKKEPKLVAAALRLKKLGNHIIEVVGGGRAIHPLNFRVGGFFKAPARAAVRALESELQWGMDTSRVLLKAFAKFDFPDFTQDYDCVSLKENGRYAIERGRIVSNRGLDVPVGAFNSHFGEEHVAHSNALQGFSRDTNRPYLVGPLARYNNNFDDLSPLAQQAAREAGLGRVVMNPFQSILVRLVETAYACEEALRLCRTYEEPPRAHVAHVVKAGSGTGATEAPRGLCFHAYTLDADGRVTLAQITPPTAQNQKQIEADLRGVVEQNLHLANQPLTLRCEQTIRNYDPCISCATHFLRLTVTHA